MSPVETIERQIEQLSSEELARLREWFAQFDAADGGNYTEERESLFQELTLDQALAAMKKTAGPQSA